jgi:hypothetical protein
LRARSERNTGEVNEDYREIQKQNSEPCGGHDDLARFWNGGLREGKSQAIIRKFWQPSGRLDQRIIRSDLDEQQSTTYQDFQRFCFRRPVFLFRASFARQFETRPELDCRREV